MVFRMCSIAGKAYRGDSEAFEESEEKSIPAKSTSVVDQPASQVVEVDIWAASGHADGSSRSQIGPDDKKIPLNSEPEKFIDSDLLEDIQEASKPGADSDPSSRLFALNGFFTVLSLCHTVLASTDATTGKMEYKAQSPDEAALVQAAADIGFVFLGKDKEVLSLRTPRSANTEKYELLDILDFTSARKRMSVVLRRLDVESNELLLLTKGADNVIFERLRPGEDQLKRETETHLNEFASMGLRTLTLGYRTIPGACTFHQDAVIQLTICVTVEEYDIWSLRYQEAIVSLDDREKRVEEIANELEQNLHLLGATAIEDRLQDGVPETIEDLKKAGIKVWVATGDKLETAIGSCSYLRFLRSFLTISTAIGRSTNLVGADSNIVIIRGGSRPVQTQMINALNQFFPEHDYEKEPDMPTLPRDTLPEIPLQRVNSGVSSIVGPENGERPGGFILVVDGAALLEVG